MDILEFIMNLFGVSQVVAIILFIFILFFLYVPLIYVVLRREMKEELGDNDLDDSIPQTIKTSSTMTENLLVNNSDPKLMNLPLHEQILRLQEMYHHRHPNQILIPVTEISAHQIPEEVDSDGDGICYICKRKILKDELYGYYPCCFEISHYSHVHAWHQQSKSCPFCRQDASFVLIKP